jgi:hypothetical protein
MKKILNFTLIDVVSPFYLVQFLNPFSYVNLIHHIKLCSLYVVCTVKKGSKVT